jgi:ribonuclease-3
MINTIRRSYNFYLSKDKALARKIKNVTGITPARMDLYKLAFFHKSMNNEVQHKGNNERLEYLGDSILSTIVADYLYQKYPNKDEGFMTKMRSKIVKRKTLNNIADRMGLDLILSDFSMGRMSSTMLGNALEALIGAIYLESGYENTRNYVVKNLIRKYLDIHKLEDKDDNFKSRLLEWCQKHNKSVDYTLLEKFKFEKRDRFKIAVMINGEKMGQAEDFNKKAAEQTASHLAIKKLGIEVNSQKSTELIN